MCPLHPLPLPLPLPLPESDLTNGQVCGRKCFSFADRLCHKGPTRRNPNPLRRRRNHASPLLQFQEIENRPVWRKSDVEASLFSRDRRYFCALLQIDPSLGTSRTSRLASLGWQGCNFFFSNGLAVFFSFLFGRSNGVFPPPWHISCNVRDRNEIRAKQDGPVDSGQTR